MTTTVPAFRCLEPAAITRIPCRKSVRQGRRRRRRKYESSEGKWKKSLQDIIYDERKRLLVDNRAIVLVLLEAANSDQLTPFLEEGVRFALIQRLLASTLHIDAFLNLSKAQLASR